MCGKCIQSEANVAQHSPHTKDTHEGYGPPFLQLSQLLFSKRKQLESPNLGWGDG